MRTKALARVIAKELIDNAVDEAEEAGVPPQIGVVVEPSCITVADRGRGIPPETVEKLVLGDESTPSVGCLRLGVYSHNFLVDIKTTKHDCAQTRLCVEGTA